MLNTYTLPSKEVHGGKLAIVGLCNMNIKRLALINKSTTIGRHLNDSLLRNLPYSLVQILQILRY